MPITITTGGPVSGSGLLSGADLRNFNDMASALADELDDSQGEYRAQIQMAVFAALRFCAREPFYFNEARDVVFNTIAGEAWYDGATHPHLGTLAGLSAVFCQKGGQIWELQRETPERMELLDGADARGAPQKFNYFGQKLRLYPRPDGDGYRIRLQLAPKRIEDIKDATQENVWFVEAFDLVFARAKYELYKNIIKDGVAAAAALADFHEQLEALRIETSRRKAQGFITPTRF